MLKSFLRNTWLEAMRLLVYLSATLTSDLTYSNWRKNSVDCCIQKIYFPILFRGSILVDSFFSIIAFKAWLITLHNKVLPLIWSDISHTIVCRVCLQASPSFAWIICESGEPKRSQLLLNLDNLVAPLFHQLFFLKHVKTHLHSIIYVYINKWKFICFWCCQR